MKLLRLIRLLSLVTFLRFITLVNLITLVKKKADDILKPSANDIEQLILQQLRTRSVLYSYLLQTHLSSQIIDHLEVFRKHIDKS